MTAFRVVVVAGMLGGFIQSGSAYNPIWSVDGWDADRLANAAITVASWKHDEIGEDRPLNWVTVTYDSSKLREDQNVLMTLCVTAANGQTICTCRAERAKGDAEKLTLLFAVREVSGSSRVEILVPNLLAAAADRDIGDPGFAGYSLRLNRIIDLAHEESAMDSDNK